MAFYKGDKVKVSAKGVASGITAKVAGKVRYIACSLATTSGGKKCDKKTCTHTIKDYIWVEWPDGKLCSYHHQELELDGVKETSVMPDAASFKAKAEEVAKKIKRAEESGALGADNGRQIEIDWNMYNTRMPGDSRARVQQRALREPEVIENDDEIDWDVYSGFKRGRVRKTGASRKG